MADNTAKNTNTKHSTNDINWLIKKFQANKLPLNYELALNKLKEYGDIKIVWEDDKDYSKIKLLDPSCPIYNLQQCRTKRDPDRVEDYKSRFDKGEKLLFPAIDIPFSEHKGAARVFGNTRGAGLAKSKNPHGVYVQIGKNLNYEERKELVLKLANFSNVEDRYHAVPDSCDDIIGQIGNAWEAVVKVDLSNRALSSSKILESNYTWKEAFESKADSTREIQEAFVKWWIKEQKGEASRWLNAISAGKIIAGVFGNKGKGNIISEWSEEQLAKKYDKAISNRGYANWDLSKYGYEQNTTGLRNTLQVYHSWGTKGGSVGNCILNLDNSLTARIRNHRMGWGVFSEVHAIIRGTTDISTVKTRKSHIQTVLNAAKDYNIKPTRYLFGFVLLPVMKIFFFPQMLRGTNVDDHDYLYIWNDSTKKFDEIDLSQKNN